MGSSKLSLEQLKPKPKKKKYIYKNVF